MYDSLSITADDGTALYVHCHRPERPTDRVLLVSHGASEHGGRYGHVAAYMADRGWNVVVPDHRGHGRSGGTAMYVDTFRTYSRDLDVIHRELRLDPRRTAMFGHSMGALVAARYHQLHAEEDRTSALVMSSPLLGVKVPIPWWKLALGHAVWFVNPRYRFETEIKIEDTTRNEQAIASRLDDALMHNHVTAGWFFAMQTAIRRAWTEAERITVPVLLLQAGDDLVVDSEASEPWLEKVGSADKTFHRFDEHYHELHNEPEWPDAVGMIADWLDERVPDDHSGSTEPFEESVAGHLSRMTNGEPAPGTTEAPLSGQTAVTP